MGRIRAWVMAMVFVFCIQGTVLPCMAYGTVSLKTAGLVREAGKYYYYQNGRKLTGQWKTVTANGKKNTYYFGRDGAAYAGKKQEGVEVPAVKKIDGDTYAFDSKGRKIRGIRVIDGKFYVFSGNGKMDGKKTDKLREASAYKADAAKLEKLLKRYGARLRKTEYYSFGCYGDGEDGMMIWDTFQVGVFKHTKGKVIVLGMYPLP